MVWLAVLGIAVVGAAVLEAAVRHRLVQVAADRIAGALQADVELHVVGRPLLWRLARRHLPQVVVAAEHLPVLDGRVRLARLDLEFDDVRLAERGADRRLTAAAARFDLRLTEAQLRELVTLPSYLTSLSVVADGLRLTTWAGVAVDADVQLAGDELEVRMSRSVLPLLPQPSFRLPLPTWPYGATVTGMALHDGWLQARGTMDPDRLVFPVVPATADVAEPPDPAPPAAGS